MRFILDTNILSMFRKKKPSPSVANWVAQTGWDEIATTVVTVMEIQRGVERARLQHPAIAKEAEEWLNGLLAAGEPQVISMDVEASRLLARMYETPAFRHFIITAPQAKNQATGADLAIAAIAIAAGATVATNNVGHFLRINDEFRLPGLFDPLSLAWHVRPASSPL